MKPNFLEELKKRREEVFPEIERRLPFGIPEKHYEMVRDYPLRKGKYFRPALVLLSNELFGGKKTDALLPAAAMQMSEDWILIHDDVEDHSDERRHKPTLHRLHGEELAINAGDALHLEMWKLAGEIARKGGKTGFQIYDALYDCLRKATEGQFLELSWIRDGKIAVSEKEYFEMIEKKTAHYTIVGPLSLGAISAGASEKKIGEIAAFGIPFGYAFQIWDDCMNLSVSGEKQGKENGGDILEGKRTLILSHLLTHASETERAEVEKIYFKTRTEKTEGEKNFVLDLMQKHGSIEYAKATARSMSETALKRFDDFAAGLPNGDAAEILREGIRFVANREA